MFKQAALLLATALLAGAAYAQGGDDAAATLERDVPQAVASRAEVRVQARAAAVQEPGEAFDGETAGDTTSTALRYQVVADARKARAAGAWPVHDYDGARVTVPRSRTARPRKEYPNVMGISFQEWLASHP